MQYLFLWRDTIIKYLNLNFLNLNLFIIDSDQSLKIWILIIQNLFYKSYFHKKWYVFFYWMLSIKTVRTTYDCDTINGFFFFVRNVMDIYMYIWERIFATRAKHIVSHIKISYCTVKYVMKC